MLDFVVNHLPQTFAEWGSFVAHVSLAVGYALEAVSEFRDRH